jgi:hypothetical protein
MTNGEMIRKMSDEQLAALIDYVASCCTYREIGRCMTCPLYEDDCDFDGALKWLKKERSDDEV